MSDWDGLGRETRARFENVVVQLKSQWPNLWSSVGSYSTEVFPLSAFVSLNTSGPPFDEDVVLFAGVQVKGTSTVFSSDISEGDGQVLAEGPVDTWETSMPMEDQIARARAGLDQFFEFTAASISVITAQLSDKASP